MSLSQSIKEKGRKVAILAATAMLAVGCIPGPAIADELDTPVIEEDIEEFSTDPEDIIASCAGAVSNYYGYLNCYMSSGNFYATIQAKTGPNPGVSGTVDCFVEFPDGARYFLGTILPSNDATAGANFYICPYGNYKFIYETDFTDEIEVQGFIFD